MAGRTKYFYGAAHEMFGPAELLLQAVEAERAGFDGIACSDHFQPWWEPGHSANAWVWLGAASQIVPRIPLGTGVTAPVFRYNPAVVAQQVATLNRLIPERTFLGIGSGEALNEVPCGMEWPEPAEQIARMDEALQIIRRLLEGERVNFDGRHFRTHGAFLHSPPETRTPIYVSAFGPEAAEVAGRWGDGLWTLPSPEETPKVVAAYERACTSERGEIILHAGVAWARDDETALRGALPFKGAEPTEFYEDDWHDPKAMFAHANEKISDEQYKKSSIISSDPDVHVRRIREIEELGATIVVVMNISGADPIGTIRTYADEVLPRLRRSRHAA